MNSTGKHKLLTEFYPGDLAADVTKALDAGQSWRTIAASVNTALPGSLSVSHESLRQWYGSEVAA